MGVLKQGVKLLPTELGCRGPPMSVVQPDKMDLTRDKVWKAGRIPLVAKLCSEGVLKFFGVER